MMTYANHEAFNAKRVWRQHTRPQRARNIEKPRSSSGGESRRPHHAMLGESIVLTQP